MGKAFETPAGSVWPLFLTAHSVLVERIEARLAGAGLPPLAWYDVLWALERAPERRLRMSELADHVVLSRSNLTRLVDRLEEAGLVARERSPHDRRAQHIRLTRAGRALAKKAHEISLEMEHETLQHLSDAERAMLLELLQRVAHRGRG